MMSDEKGESEILINEYNKGKLAFENLLDYISMDIIARRQASDEDLLQLPLPDISFEQLEEMQDYARKYSQNLRTSEILDGTKEFLDYEKKYWIIVRARCEEDNPYFNKEESPAQKKEAEEYLEKIKLAIKYVQLEEVYKFNRFN